MKKKLISPLFLPENFYVLKSVLKITHFSPLLNQNTEEMQRTQMCK